MVTLIDKSNIKIRFVDKPELIKYLNSPNWKKSELLKRKFNEEIYVSDKNKILVNCIYGPKGLLFESLIDYEKFNDNCSFVYIPSKNLVFFIEHVNQSKYEYLINEEDLKVDSVLSKKIGSDIYFNHNGRLYVLDRFYKNGFVYSSLKEYLLIRKEYGFDDSDIIISVGDFLSSSNPNK